MRPTGEVSEALLGAVDALATAETAPTAREVADRALVGYDAAYKALKNLVRSKKLHIPRTRPVDYRNKPVAEYARSQVATLRPGDGWEAWREVGHAFCRRVA